MVISLNLLACHLPDSVIGGEMLTDNKATEERIDPSHNKSLRNNHRHIALHHIHHLIHSCGIGHWVSGWFPNAIGIL